MGIIQPNQGPLKLAFTAGVPFRRHQTSRSQVYIDILSISFHEIAGALTSERPWREPLESGTPKLSFGSAGQIGETSKGGGSECCALSFTQ